MYSKSLCGSRKHSPAPLDFPHPICAYQKQVPASLHGQQPRCKDGLTYVVFRNFLQLRSDYKSPTIYRLDKKLLSLQKYTGCSQHKAVSSIYVSHTLKLYSLSKTHTTFKRLPQIRGRMKLKMEKDKYCPLVSCSIKDLRNNCDG